MGKKHPIKRQRKYKITMKLSENMDILIQANWYDQNKVEPRAETNFLDNDLKNRPCSNELQIMPMLDDLELHRRTRSISKLVQVYLIKELSVAMMVIDIICILTMRICLTWMSLYSFLRVIPRCTIYLLDIHLLYCILIYVSEKRKDKK